MLTPELLRFIKKQREDKKSDEQIATMLKNTGWREKDIKIALNIRGDLNTPPPPYEPEIKNIESGYKNVWDAFQHILLFITLYVSTISFGSVIFSLINFYIPKSNISSYYEPDPLQTAKFPMAALVVCFPIFAYLFLKIANYTKKNPEIKGLLTRKILIYLTLVIAFLTTIGTLVVTVYGLFDGNLSRNFVFKAVTILVLACSIIFYYLDQVKVDRKS